MGLNEQLKANLETGQTKFASAATELQTIKDEIDQVAQNLSPEEQKWVGEAYSVTKRRSTCSMTQDEMRSRRWEMPLLLNCTKSGLSLSKEEETGLTVRSKESSSRCKREEEQRYGKR